VLWIYLTTNKTLNQGAKYASLIKEKAKNLGFMACGISKADFLEDQAPRLEKWLKQGHHGKMSYMERNFDKRLDPRLLVDGAKSVVSLLYNYYPSEENRIATDSYKISKYAYGQDYHKVIKDLLYELLHEIQREIGEVHGRVFVDSAPILEKAWAERSGLGWVGKNTNLIQKQTGSYFFIAELIIDLELEADSPTTDHCGSCTACIDACPTQAIIEPYKLDGSKCISYFTIELKEEIPQAYKNQFEDWIFGCDVCQDVCPWNKFSKPHGQKLFELPEALKSYEKADWHDLTEATFGRLFKESAIQRTKYRGLKRNIDFVSTEK
jgi:epoxyqueuosine reductase